MAPLYDQVCTLAWPELSRTLSMKIGSASALSEVSPEHFKQLSAEAKLGWPMVRERLTKLCLKMAETIRRDDPAAATGKDETTPAGIALQRAERMLRLMER